MKNPSQQWKNVTLLFKNVTSTSTAFFTALRGVGLIEWNWKKLYEPHQLAF